MSDTCPAVATLHDVDENGDPLDIELSCDTTLADHIVITGHHDPDRGDWGDYLRTADLDLPVATQLPVMPETP